MKWRVYSYPWNRSRGKVKRKFSCRKGTVWLVEDGAITVLAYRQFKGLTRLVVYERIPGVPVLRETEIIWKRETMLERKKVNREEGHAPQALGTSKILKDVPSIVAHCNVTRFTDGTPREPGTLFIRQQQGQWVVTVKEPSDKAMLTVRDEDLDAALKTLAAMLVDPEAVWEHDPWAKASGPRRGKKRGS